MRIKQIVAPLVLTCVLALSVMAGESEMGPSAMPTPTPCPSTSQHLSVEPADAGPEIDSGVLVNVVETVAAFISSLFS